MFSETPHSNLTFSINKHCVLFSGFDSNATEGTGSSLTSLGDEQEDVIRTIAKKDLIINFFIL